MTFTLLSPTLLSLSAVMILVCTLKARKAGFLTSAISLAITVASAYIAAVLAALSSMLTRGAVSDICSDFGWFDFLPDDEKAFIPVFNQLIGVLFSIIIYIPMFILVYLIMRGIIRLLFKGKLNKSDFESDEFVAEDSLFIDKKDRLLATITGVVCGLAMSIIVFSPIVGLVKNLAPVVKMVDDAVDEEDNEFVTNFEGARDFADDFTVTIYDIFGGGSIFDVTTTFVFHGRLTNLPNEIRILEELDIADVIDSMSEKEEFDDEAISAARRALRSAEKSPILKMFLTVFANNLGEAWLNGESYLEVSRPESTMNDNTVEITDQLLTVIARTNERTVCDDIGTMLVIIEIFSDYSEELTSGDYELLADALVNNDLLKKLEDEIESNPRMSFLQTYVDDVLIRAVSSEINDIMLYSDEMREDLYVKIADVLTSTRSVSQEKRVEMVTEDLCSMLTEFGLYNDEFICNEIADKLINDIAVPGRIVDASNIEDYLASYIDFDE